MTQVTPHFTLQELMKSNEATRHGIDNTTTDPTIIANLTALAVNVLEPLRVYLGKPVVIYSGYRSPETNAAVKGATKSQHLTGHACDFHVPNFSHDNVAAIIRQIGLPFDQLILEFFDPTNIHAGWVHVSYDPTRNRREYLIYGNDKVYRKG